MSARINTLKRIQIIGVVKDQTIRSLGTVKTKIDFNGVTLEHNFHVINQNLNLNADAVIGNDFLAKNNALIDYLNKTLTVRIIDNPPITTFNNNTNTKIVSMFSTKISENTESNSCKKYQQALQEFSQSENQNIHMISRYKPKNKTFYEDLPEEFFNEHEQIEPIRPTINPITPLILNPNEYSINHMGQESNQITDKNERMEYLMDKFNLNHLNDELKEKIREICYHYSDAFYVEGDTLKPTNAYVHSIKLKPNVDVVHVKQYRIPENHKEEIERQINDLERKRIIEKSTSRFNSPLLLAKKASVDPGKPQFRLVLDYRKINEATIPQAYPIPLIDEIIDQMNDATCFTKLDV